MIRCFNERPAGSFALDARVHFGIRFAIEVLQIPKSNGYAA